MKREFRAVACTAAVMLAASHPAAAQEQAPIRIGAIFAVTGPASFLGAPEAKTAQMMVDQINARGGLLGRPLDMVLKDSGGSPERAELFCRQLIEKDEVTAIIGPSTSGETLRIKQLCEDARMILVSCAAAEVIVNPVARYVFKSPQKDSQAVTWIYRTMKAKGIDRIGVVSSNTGFGRAGREQLQTMAPEAGITIAANEVYDQAAADLTDIMIKLRAAGVQSVVNWAIEPAQSIVPRTMRQLGMTVPLFQSHGFGNLRYVEQAGAAAEGILFPAGRLLVADTLPDDHPQKALLLQYRKDYEGKYNEAASTFGGHAYDALLIVTRAIEAAGSVDREKVRDAIETLKGLVGTAGIFNFSAEDHNGLGLDAFDMLTVRDGKFARYAE